MNVDSTRSIILYFLLALGIALLVVEAIDLNNILYLFGDFNSFSDNYYQKCVFYQTASECIMISLQICLACLMIFSSLLYLLPTSNFLTCLKKLCWKGFIIIFGPIMLGFCLLGFVYWSEIMSICTGNTSTQDFIIKTNIFVAIILIFQFIISFIITIVYAGLEVIVFHVASLMRKEEGSDLVRKAFYYFATRQLGNRVRYEGGLNNHYNRSENNIDNLNRNEDNIHVNNHDILNASHHSIND